jgi:hypothetical protein
MSDVYDGGPAFPVPPVVISEELARSGITFNGEPGMSLRQWYAGILLQGLLAGGHASVPYQEGWERAAERMAHVALVYADALLRAQH